MGKDVITNPYEVPLNLHLCFKCHPYTASDNKWKDTPVSVPKVNDHPPTPASTNATTPDMRVSSAAHPPTLRFPNANTTADKKSKWDADFLHCPVVNKGYAKLSMEDGRNVMCTVCNLNLRMKHPFNLFNWHKHVNTDSHRAKESAHENTLARLKNGVDKREKIMHQSTLFGFKFIAKKRVKKPCNSIANAIIPSCGSEAPVAIDIDDINESFVIGSTKSGCGSTNLSSSKAKTITCEGIIPLNDKSIRMQLDLYKKYATPSPTSTYHVKHIGDSFQSNLYSNECDGAGITRWNKKHSGVRCVSCQQMWTARSSKLTKMVKDRCKKFRGVEVCLMLPTLSEEHADEMQNFARTKQSDLSEPIGLQLLQKVKV